MQGVRGRVERRETARSKYADQCVMTIRGYSHRTPFGYWEKRFASRPMIWDALLPVHYLNCPDLGLITGFFRQATYTILIDLAEEEQSIFAAFKANTRNEISRAEREGAEMRVSHDSQRFLNLYSS